MEKDIYNYFRYHHFNTHPAKESHSGYIDNLNSLEQESGITIPELDGFDLKKTWVFILKAINALDEKGIDRLHSHVIHHKENIVLQRRYNFSA